MKMVVSKVRGISFVGGIVSMSILFSVNVNPEQSEIIQLVAFDNGYSWYPKVKTPQYTNENMLNFWNDKLITFDDQSEQEPLNEPIVSVIDAINIILGNIPIPEKFKTLTIGKYKIIILQ